MEGIVCSSLDADKVSEPILSHAHNSWKEDSSWNVWSEEQKWKLQEVDHDN